MSAQSASTGKTALGGNWEGRVLLGGNWEGRVLDLLRGYYWPLRHYCPSFVREPNFKEVLVHLFHEGVLLAPCTLSKVPVLFSSTD